MVTQVKDGQHQLLSQWRRDLPDTANALLIFAIVSLLILSACLIPIHVIALPPITGGLDYTRDIPLSEAIEYAWAMGFTRTLSIRLTRWMSLFVPISAIGLVAYVVWIRRWPRVIALFNILFPLLCMPPIAILGIVYYPLDLPMALLGRVDGEVWSEGWVAYAAASYWSAIWMAVFVLSFGIRKRSQEGMCPNCEYDLRATPGSCPECGWASP